MAEVGDENHSRTISSTALSGDQPSDQDLLALLAAAIGDLSPEDRAKLARMLAGG